MDTKPRKSRKRWYWILGLSLVAMSLDYAVGRNLLAWYGAWQFGRLNPRVYVLPTPIPDTSLAELTDQRVEMFGIEFQTPWQSKVVRKSQPLPNFERSSDHVLFADSHLLFVSNPGSGLGRETEWRRHKLAEINSETKKIISSDGLNSNYKFLSAVLRATPDDAKWWASPATNRRIALLLAQKYMSVHESTAIYEIRTRTLRGFQLGNPTADGHVRIYLFDPNDLEYTIEIGPSIHSPKVTQPEINAIVASIHPLAASANAVPQVSAP